jgi:mannosyltransferase
MDDVAADQDMRHVGDVAPGRGLAAPRGDATRGAGPGAVAARATPAAARLYWLWPALLTLGYGLWGIRTPSLWADELATWGAVRLSWRSLYQMLGNVDAVVAPYYSLVKVWTDAVGTSTVALRLPSVGAMAAAAALVAVLGARLCGGRWAGLLSGLGFAVVPTTSRYAQEARPYAFAVLFAVLATLLLLRLADRPSPGTGAGYALAVAGLGAFHLVALLLLLAHPAVLLRYRQRQQRIRTLAVWAVSAGAGVLPLLPLAVLGSRQGGQISWIRPARLDTLLSAPDTLFVSGAVAGFVIALALLAFSRRWQALLLISWALVPVLTLYLVAEITPLFWPRYLLFTTPAWVLLAALTLTRLSRTWAAAVLVALVLLAYPTQNEVRAADGHSHGDREAAWIITLNERPGDAIAYRLDDQPEPWEGRDLVAKYVPAGRQPRDVFAVTPQRTGGHLLATECRDLAACLARADPSRIWVIRFGEQTDPLKDIGRGKEQLLRSRYRLDRLWLVKGLTVALYASG